MAITDFKAFYDKYHGKGTSVPDIAKAEGITESEAKEAKDFLLKYNDFKPEMIIKMWDQMQFSKAHPYVPPAGGTPTGFGASGVVQETMAGMTRLEYWTKMEGLIESVVRRILATPNK